MKTKSLKRCSGFSGGDNSKLREFLDPKKERSKLNYTLAYERVEPKQKTLKHQLKYTEVYLILERKGIMYSNKETNNVNSGDKIYILPNSMQFIENRGEIPLESLWIVELAWKPDCEEVFRRDG
ncbi:MAG: cupin domain-containing protein [bacterium]